MVRVHQGRECMKRELFASGHAHNQFLLFAISSRFDEKWIIKKHVFSNTRQFLNCSLVLKHLHKLG